MPGLVAGLVVLLCLLFVALVVGILNGVPKRDEGHLLPRDDEDEDEWWDGIR